MKNLRPFQIVMLAIFGVFAIGSLVILAGFDAVGRDEVNPYGDQVQIWGTIDAKAMKQTLDFVGESDEFSSVISYTQMDPRTFQVDLVNAIADGKSPDVVLIAHEELVSLRSKIQPIPYQTITRRDIRDWYVDGSEIFALEDGLYAVPVAVDPLLMYWNRDTFAAAGFATAPRTWQEIVSATVPALTVRDTSRNVIRSALPFGEYRNVRHGKEILISLLLQSGSRLIEEDNSQYLVAINQAVSDNARKPLIAATEFYTDFSNPNSVLYTWNRSFQDDWTAFVGEDLALYFAPGSDLERIQEGNPNLNFDVVPLPQGVGATVKRTYGTFHGFSIMRASDNQAGAFRALQVITSPDASLVLNTALGMAPVHRSVLSEAASEPNRQAVFDGALIARGWLDPNPAKSDDVFRELIDTIVSGRIKVTEAAEDAVRRLELAF